MTPTNTEALAEWLENHGPRGPHQQAAAELRRLSAVEAERDNLRHELAEVKRNAECAAGMAELVRQRRDELEAERDALRAALQAIRHRTEHTSYRMGQDIANMVDAAMKGTQ